MVENVEKIQSNTFSQMDNSIKAKDRIIAWPRMGRIDIPLKALLVSLGAKVIIPPYNSNEALEIGVKNSIEGICLPYKLNLANYIMALEKGANTLMMFQAPGSCRLGNYTKMAQKTLKSMGYEFDMVIFDMYKSQMVQTVRAFWHVTRTINPYRYLKGFGLGFLKFFAMDDAEKMLWKIRPREIKRGDAEKCYNKWLDIIDKTNSLWGMCFLFRKMKKDFAKIPIVNKKVPVVYLLGEFFVLLDPYTNQNIEKELGEMGVEVQRQIMFGDWLGNILIPSFMGKRETHRERAVRYAEKYMKRAIGGECIETVGDTVFAARHGVDGVIHLMPFSCMPEIVSQNILSKVSKEEDIPILTLVLDEQTGKAGYMTRIEAFIDLVKRKKDKKVLNKNSKEKKKEMCLE